MIDAKRYRRKRVRLIKRGWLFDRRTLLTVGGRNRTNLVEAMNKQVLAVSKAMAPQGTQAPLIPVLCFVDGEIDLLAWNMSLNGVRITWRRELRKLLRRPGPLNAVQIEQIAGHLSQRLPRR